MQGFANLQNPLIDGRNTEMVYYAHQTPLLGSPNGRGASPSGLALAFSKDRRMYKAHQVRGEDPFVEVVKTEEKGTDVNIASHMIVDAADDLLDCAILISGDSDLTTPVKLCIGKYGKIVGVLNPQKQKCMTLEKEATFYKHIRESALASSQFEAVLTDAQGSFHKPAKW
jgi:hypothetical protein